MVSSDTEDAILPTYSVVLFRAGAGDTLLPADSEGPGTGVSERRQKGWHSAGYDTWWSQYDWPSRVWHHQRWTHQVLRRHACKQNRSHSPLPGPARCSSSDRHDCNSVPGGIAKLPFMKGGLESAGIACIGGPGLNCMFGGTKTEACRKYNASQVERRLWWLVG